ncbi:ATP-binding protein [Bartonella sp. HY329]|uniref:ATP-binding protein n=1 Tax=unclassified Bartonella TaxID=2645622 RepID=UPI0021CA7423|nr:MULTISPECIES: ATP-binding protein [unclassified Bartonella]UXM93974.1 ATP-binding protein [Bartonella sp. HY329]UXN08295.1 ATP-binding protein [Bartonella sp. HY328]
MGKIKAKSHILSLLGDQLIGSDGLAIFELVKNAYDADAENVNIEFKNLNTSDQEIIIADDGHGMSTEVIDKVWFTVGTDFKRKVDGKKSPKGRVSLGNKGVGRLAVHKLARQIKVETKTLEQATYSEFIINWRELIDSQEYIQDLEVEIEQCSASADKFPKNQGTIITLSGLYNTNWSKTQLRDVVRAIENIKNPFKDIDGFNVIVNANEKQVWLEGLKSSTDILRDSLYQFEFVITPWIKGADNKKNIDPNDIAEFRWKYVFNPSSQINIDKRNIDFQPLSTGVENKNLLLVGSILSNSIEGVTDTSKYLRNKDIERIGQISGRFYVFNLHRKILESNFGGQITAVKNYINENCGVRIYRDNIRVFNYGEPSDDWLGLDLQKIRRTGDHFGRKVTIGAIELDLAASDNGLQEKTNREGFFENEVYSRLKNIVNVVFNLFENEAKKDKVKIDEFTSGQAPIKKIGFSETVQELINKLEQKGLTKEFGPLINKVKQDYDEMRDIMVNSGMTGLNLGVAFHEIEREMRYIDKELMIPNIEMQSIKDKVKDLIQLLSFISPLLKQQKNVEIKVSKYINNLKLRYEGRFKRHNIIFSSPILTGENEDFKIVGQSNLLANTFSNMIDNAIFWLEARYDRESKETYKKGLYIGTDMKSFGGPAVIIADNGTGFTQDPETLITPFVSTKPDGMGLGLYFSSMVMDITKGKLLFPDVEDLDIPKVYDGACVALVFPNK